MEKDNLFMEKMKGVMNYIGDGTVLKYDFNENTMGIFS